MKKNTPFEWTVFQQTAFDILKRKLTKEPILVHPDFTKMFKLYTDASDVGLGVVLMQRMIKEKIELYAIKPKPFYQQRKITLPLKRNVLR